MLGEDMLLPLCTQRNRANMFTRDDVPIWFIREELSKWLNRDIPSWFAKEDLSGLLTGENLPAWLWAALVPQNLGRQIPPDFVLDPRFTFAEAKNMAAESEAMAGNPKQKTFHYAAIKTRHCVDDELAFSEGLAKVYARILEDRDEKVFLKGNAFISKLAKAVFEQNPNLFAEACGKYADEKYFRECAKAMEQWNFSIEEGEEFNEESWFSLYKVVLLLTEEYLATKCELPKIDVLECEDNDESSGKLEIVIARQDSSESELGEAAWLPLKERDFGDSSDELKVGDLFYEFLGKNFPKNKIAKYKSLPHPTFKICAMGTAQLGSYEDKIISINQRIALDSLSEENQKTRFFLLLTMLLEYGRFLSDVQREKAKQPVNNLNENDGIDFANEFMKYSDGKLLKENFKFVDFIALGAKGEDRRFVLDISLSYEQRKEILYILKTARS